MKLSKAILVSICILPLVTVSYAEDANKQNMRIVERSVVSMHEAAPVSLQMNNENVPLENQSRAINNSNDVEVDKEQGFRWPWQNNKRHTINRSERSSESIIRK